MHDQMIKEAQRDLENHEKSLINLTSISITVKKSDTFKILTTCRIWIHRKRSHWKTLKKINEKSL